MRRDMAATLKSARKCLLCKEFCQWYGLKVVLTKLELYDIARNSAYGFLFVNMLLNEKSISKYTLLA